MRFPNKTIFFLSVQAEVLYHFKLTRVIIIVLYLLLKLQVYNESLAAFVYHDGVTILGI